MASGARIFAILVIVGGLGTLAYRWHLTEQAKLDKARAELQQVDAALAERKAAPDAPIRKPAETVTIVTQQTVTVTVGPASAQPPQNSFARSARIAEALATGMRARVSMVEFHQQEGRWPLSNKEAGLAEPDEFRTSRFHSLHVWPNGKMELVLLREAGRQESLVLRATINGAGNPDWRCSSPDVPDIAQLRPECTYQPY